MKKLITIFAFISVFCFKANAGLITNESIDIDGNLLVEFHLNDANPELWDFAFTLEYDTNVLVWDEFYGDDFIGYQVNYAIEDYVFTDGEDLDHDGIFDLYGFFYDGWAIDIGTDLFLGSAKFLVDGNLLNSNFDINTLYAFDMIGDDIQPTLAIEHVPEPPAMALFSLVLFACCRLKRRNV